MSKQQDGVRRVRAYHLVCGLIDAVLAVLTKRRVGPAQLPPGPLLIAPNHVSSADPLVVACAVLRRGRVPRFVIRAEVMRWPVVGAVLRYFDHLPLDRDAKGDTSRLEPIERALRRGECVVVYPEGKLTPREDLMPGRGQPGVALLSAATGAPIVPVATWGTHELLRDRRSTLLAWPPRRPRVDVVFGRALPPVAPGSLSDAVRATRALMAELTELTAQARRGWERADSGSRAVADAP
ncbi:MAG TPA: lysophospholipid acyltransferase family protein [Motilibacteraceae bacterium]|nr:lysophospholipid acyltransferase family protein [Motilibacteraceae bacterium]